MDDTSSSSSSAASIRGEESAGVIPRALRELFQTLQQRTLNPGPAPPGTRTTFRYEIRLQFLELYGEEVRDLLSTSPTTAGGLKIRDNGGATGSEPDVVGASEITVKNADEALLCLARGMLRRVTGATAMNAESSRSHAIMTAVIEQTSSTYLDDDENDDDDDGETSYTRSKFHFVDLAGSERARRTMATGQRLTEGININKGLLVLGNVISALGDPKKVGKTHVPYRDSKLTRLLRGSLGGNHRTLMVACVSPSSSNMAESINTLRYSNRARNIQNRAIVNVDPTTRLVGELRTRVKDLAGELLRVRAILSEIGEEAIKINGPFSDEALNALAAGGETSISSSSTAVTASISSQPAPADAVTLQQRLAESDAELARVVNSLKRTKQESYQNEEGLYAAKAEAEYWKMKSHATAENGGGLDLPDAEPATNGPDASVMARMASYEKEIAMLKSDLRKATSRTELAMTQMGGQSPVSKSSHTAEQRAPAENPTEKTLQFAEVPVLSTLQSTRQDKRHRTELEEEDKAERQEFEKITDRYLSDDEDIEQENDGDEAVGLAPASSDLSASSSGLTQYAEVPFVDNVDDAATAASVESFLRRQSHMDAHLLELTSSIAAKEDLMEQLAASQRRYESMREFYERKLEEMVAQLEARERERESLAAQLDALKNHEPNDEKRRKQFTELTKDLAAKDAHIKKLRRRQKELTGLTEVPSRNEAVLARLKADVAAMKRQKVELQKQVSAERKSHLLEVARLRKDATQRSREAAKWRVMSERQKAEAERAKNAAKSHVQEISKLRSRYRESEKRLRMQTLKRGVMEKVGLDPVLVGRRGGRPTRPATAPPSAGGNQLKKVRRKASVGTIDDVDIDRVRSFLDSKVADIGQKEATAEKLANEYEDHLELTERRNQLLQEIDGSDENPVVEEELEALGIQIQYREGRIRQLSKRLGDAPSRKSEKSGSTVVGNTFLSDNEFKSLCAGAPPISASQLTCKILFGMVVRERRRVISLARTAASLDERAAEAEKLAEAREEALVSHVEEERHERALMAHNQQEQIMSLMALVRNEEEEPKDKAVPSYPPAYEIGADAHAAEAEEGARSIKPGRSTNSMVMILSNERIAVLEGQIAELEGEKEAKAVHRKNEAEARQELKERARELNEAQAELQHLKSSLRQVREMLAKERKGGITDKLAKENAENGSLFAGDEDTVVATECSETTPETTYRLVDDVIREALHPPALSPRKGASDRNKLLPDNRLNVTSPPYYSPGMKSHVTLMQASDSEDEDVPEWASDIMADLEIIAQGRMPPSLKKVKKKKNKRKGPSKKPPSPSPPSTADKHNASSAGATKISAVSHTQEEETNVFERLTAPENWTGAQKQSTGAQKQTSCAALAEGPSPKSIETKSEMFESPVVQSSKKLEEKKTLPKKPVFDRLTDPEYFTGVQKQSFMSASTQRQQQHPATVSDSNTTATAAADDVADETISEILDSQSKDSASNHAEEQTQEDGESVQSSHQSSESNLSTASIASASGPRSVFDRLISPSNYTGTQKTAHAAAATTTKRKPSLIESPVAGDVLTSLHVAAADVQSSPMAHPDDSNGQRESGSNKGHEVSDDQTAQATQGQNRERIAEYTQQDVFERLTKTVTASYAVKHQAEE